MQLMVSLRICMILFVVTWGASHVQFQDVIYAPVLYDVLQDRFVQIKHKCLLSVLLSTLLLCQCRAWSSKFSLPPSPALHCLKEMPSKSQRKRSVPSGLSPCFIAEAPHRWTTACTGKTPPILKLDSWVSYQSSEGQDKLGSIYFLYAEIL